MIISTNNDYNEKTGVQSNILHMNKYFFQVYLFTNNYYEIGSQRFPTYYFNFLSEF